MQNKSRLILATFCAANFSYFSHINPENSKTADPNLVKNIAEKYESQYIDPGVITFENFYADLKGSYLISMLKQSVFVNFQISETNASAHKFIYYPDDSTHGVDAKAAYEKIVQDRSTQLIQFSAILTIVANIAQYFGHNTQMNESDREKVITQDLLCIVSMYDYLQNQTDLNFIANNLFTSELKSYTDDTSSLFSHILAGNFSDDLFTKYLNVNYNDITVNANNLHNTDDVMSKIYIHNSDHTVHTADIPDWFTIVSGNISFRINLLNHLKWYLSDQNNYDFMLSDPSDFDYYNVSK